MVQGLHLTLNISLQHSCGLILGRVDQARSRRVLTAVMVWPRFSFNLPACQPSAVIHLPLSTSPSVVCLEGGGQEQEQCKGARLLLAPPPQPLDVEAETWVESIPVIWKRQAEEGGLPG